MTTRTRSMAYIAVLSAISFLLMYLQFQLLPGVDFLKLDFSILPILLGLVVMDLKSSFIILLCRSLLQLLLNNNGASSMIGMPMNVIAYAFFVLFMGLIWKKAPSLKTYIQASVMGTLSLTIAMLVLNVIYAMPLYAMFANFDIEQIIGARNYIFGIVLPFNVLQGLIFGIVFYFVYQGLYPFLKKI